MDDNNMMEMDLDLWDEHSEGEGPELQPRQPVVRLPPAPQAAAAHPPPPQAAAAHPPPPQAAAPPPPYEPGPLRLFSRPVLRLRGDWRCRSRVPGGGDPLGTVTK
ncbi:hypothetical protein FQN54_003846 [Arachnomyces sp. PD_36]|nr:hypothetical protein FQN54_003846 [Arachnomyces sp. PD_36]